MLKAAFTIAAWYEVSAECLTPIRTGGTDNDPETLLLTKRLTPVRTDGNGADAETVFMDAQPVLLLQGSSLAGRYAAGWRRTAETLTRCSAVPPSGDRFARAAFAYPTACFSLKRKPRFVPA